MIMIRTERKKHGTGNLIEGLSDDHMNVILIEDVVTSGTSIRETLSIIQGENNIRIVGCVCVVNRSKSPVVPETSIPLIGLWNESDLNMITPPRLPFSVRSEMACTETARSIFKLMDQKQTNVMWSADLTSMDDVTGVLIEIGNHIVGVKLHYDIFSHETSTHSINLFNAVVEKHSLIVLNDRKYADIENIVSKQCHADQTKYHGSRSTGLELSTVHSASGDGAIRALNTNGVSTLIVAEMSNQNSRIDPRRARQFAQAHPQSVSGFICQNRTVCESGDGFIYFTPGINLNVDSDGSDQQYRDCETAIGTQRCDVVIIGRGITNAIDRKTMAMQYQKAAWNALLK